MLRLRFFDSLLPSNNYRLSVPSFLLFLILFFAGITTHGSVMKISSVCSCSSYVLVLLVICRRRTMRYEVGCRLRWMNSWVAWSMRMQSCSKKFIDFIVILLVFRNLLVTMFFSHRRSQSLPHVMYVSLSQFVLRIMPFGNEIHPCWSLCFLYVGFLLSYIWKQWIRGRWEPM